MESTTGGARGTTHGAWLPSTLNFVFFLVKNNDFYTCIGINFEVEFSFFSTEGSKWSMILISI